MGRRPQLNPHQINEARQRLAKGETTRDLAKVTPSVATRFRGCLLMFEQPAKRDIDAALSILMHETRRHVQDAKNRITSEAIKHGAFQSNRVIVAVADDADKAHKASIEQAKKILLDFIERMQLPARQITDWARPHLENLSNSVIGVIPPNGFPNDHQRIVRQYTAVFQQRVDLALRDVEIGYVKGAGFAARTAMPEERITLAEALAFLEQSFPPDQAKARIRRAFVQKALDQQPMFALPYDEAEIDWATGSVKIPRKRERFYPTFQRAELVRYFFEIATTTSPMTDAEIRGRLLKHFYELRNNNDGWVPTSEIILSPEPVSRRAIANVCQQLAEAGYIQWHPFKPPVEHHVIGRTKITGPGVDSVERSGSASLEIRFPSKSGPPASSPTLRNDAPMSDAALGEIREVVSTIKAELPALTLSNSAKAEITADLNQIEVETERPIPRRRFMKLYLESLRDNLAKAAGAATAGGAVALAALVGGLIIKHFGIF
jgi:hypothetical protein